MQSHDVSLISCDPFRMDRFAYARPVAGAGFSSAMFAVHVGRLAVARSGKSAGCMSVRFKSMRAIESLKTMSVKKSPPKWANH